MRMKEKSEIKSCFYITTIFIDFSSNINFVQYPFVAAVAYWRFSGEEESFINYQGTSRVARNCARLPQSPRVLFHQRCATLRCYGYVGYLPIIFIGEHSLALVEADSTKICFFIWKHACYGCVLWMRVKHACYRPSRPLPSPRRTRRFPTIDT
jgi:hypothetical protein